MDYSWLTTSWTPVLMVIITTIGIYVTLIIYTRFAGLRSFSKMSSFDFAMTVAIGSLMASTILTKNPPLLQSMVALAMLYLLQMMVAWLRRKSKSISKTVDNEPLLLMRGQTVLDENLNKAKMTHDDLRAKLREANVTRISQIKAVVMETTGDISVLHHEDNELDVEADLLADVRGANV